MPRVITAAGGSKSRDAGPRKPRFALGQGDDVGAGPSQNPAEPDLSDEDVAMTTEDDFVDDYDAEDDAQLDAGDGPMPGVEGIGDDESAYDTERDDNGEMDSEPEDSVEEEIIVNVDELRYGDVGDVATRSALDLDEVLGAGSYEEDVFGGAAEVSLPFQDESDGSATITGDTIEDIPGSAASAPGAAQTVDPTVTPTQDGDPDTSVLLRMHQNKSIETSSFEKALAAYAELTGMSRKHWDGLLEALLLVRGQDGLIPPMIEALPKQLSTLKDRLRKRLPMMDMREADIPLNVLKLPTLPASLKPEERRRIEAVRAHTEAKAEVTLTTRAAAKITREKGKKSAEAKAAQKAAEKAKIRLEKLKGKAKDPEGADMELDLPKIFMKLTFFDPPSVFKNLVASDIGRRAHSGPGHIVDEPRELFESHAWLSSVRATSGRYAHVVLDDEPTEQWPVVFPSDWIYFFCTNDDCALDCRNADDPRDIHIGRVYGVGLDRRSHPCTSTTEELAIQVQEAHRIGSTGLAIEMSPPHEETELVLTAVPMVIPEANTYSLTRVYVDRHWGEDHRDPGWKLSKGRGKPKAPFPKYDKPVYRLDRDEEEYYFVRRMIDKSGENVVPMCHTHPIRAELELYWWGRDVFESQWDQAKKDNLPVISFPHLDFIDGFGVFSNSYRTLMGFYFTPAGLTEAERSRPGSIFPIVLGPHASDFGDVIKALKTMSYLDEGMVMDINGKTVRLCAFPMCYIGDMPQQAENSGLKGPRANKFCRCCFVFAGQKASDADVLIKFDTVTNGRYHNQLAEMQHMLGNAKNASEANHYGSQWGLSTPHPPLAAISPALDLIMSRPIDAAHSEYNGLGNLMHFLLRDGILNKRARTEYALSLRSWPFPPGWARLMSPIHHLSSYKMSHHAQWIVIVPAFLLSWLKEDHIKPGFYQEAEQQTGRDPVAYIIETTAAIAKSTSVLMGNKISMEDRKNMDKIIHRARHMFNQLCLFAAATSGGSRAGSTIGTPVPDDREVAGEVAGEVGAERGESSRSLQYMNDTLRPNIHAAAHFPEFAEEYALPVNCNTLTGEDLHRTFKTRVYETNYSNVEKVLLMKLNFQETIRFLLRGAFEHDDPELTTEMMELHRQCPNLFGRVLSRADRNEMNEALLEEADHEVSVDQSANSSHLSPSAINRIPASELATQRSPANDGRLPTRAGNGFTTVTWRYLLRLAYYHDYGKAAEYPSAFENRPIQWSRKFGFTDRATNTRFTFGAGDYVQFTRGSAKQFGRVQHIFVLDNFDDRHIFVILAPVICTGKRHDLLDQEIMEEPENEAIIVGIPAIDPVCLYMVPINNVGTVWIDWDVHTL